MSFVLSVVVGVLFGVGIYLLLQKTQMKVIIGLLLISNATNLMIFVAGGVGKKIGPLIEGEVLSIDAANPLPQALILTAIVIGFGVLAYFIVLSQRLYATISEQKLEALSDEESVE